MAEEEIVRLRTELEYMTELNAAQEQIITKLKKKIEKERQQHAMELSSIHSLKDTLQTTLAQVQDLYTRSITEIQHQKARSDQYQQKEISVKEKNKKLKEENWALRQQIRSQSQATVSKERTAAAPSSPVPSITTTLDGSSSSRSGSFTSGSNSPLSSPKLTRASSDDSFPEAKGKDSPSSLHTLGQSQTLRPSRKSATLAQLYATAVQDIEKTKWQPDHNHNLESSSESNSSYNRSTPLPSVVPSPVARTGSQNSLGVPESPGSSSKIPEKKLTLSVISPDLTLTTIALSGWTVAQTIAKWKNKFPGDTSNYGIFFKSGRRIVKRLEDDKTLGFYLKQIEDPKVEILFQNINSVEKPKSKVKVTLENVLEAIKQQDIRALKEYLLESDSKLDFMEQLDKDFGQLPIHTSIRSNNTEIVTTFLKYYEKYHLSINMQDRDGWTSLHYAVCNNTGNDSDEEILRAVLDFPGVQVDIENTDKNTPLHYFASKFICPSCPELGDRLITSAPGTLNQKNKNGETPLHKAIFNPAVRVLMVKLLIKKGADVNVQTAGRGDTALHYAVRLGRLDLLKILIQAGANMSIRDLNQKMTPYELAVQTKQEKIAQTIQNAQDLLKWLQELKLEEYFLTFVKEELYLDILAWIEETVIENILDNMGINELGTRLRFKKACKEVKDQQSKKAFEARLAKAMTQANNDLKDALPQEQLGKLKRDLSSVLDKQDETNWLLEHSKIEFTKELGNGKAGTVFKGLFEGKKVAIKVLKSQSKAGTIEEFKKEFHIMSILRSPHIVHFFGACLEPRICIVLEYCARGSLHHFLKRDSTQLSISRAFQFALETTAALRDLHTSKPPVYHRDMKSLNLLVTKDYHIKICDFGLARVKTEQNMETMGKLRGTYAYLAPELFSGDTSYSDKSDIFSLAIILWEIFNAALKGKYDAPYSDTNFKVDIQIYYQVSKKQMRPTMPSTMPEPIKSLITRSWDENPDTRPSATELYDLLTAMEKEFVKEEPTNNNSAVVIAPEVVIDKLARRATLLQKNVLSSSESIKTEEPRPHN